MRNILLVGFGGMGNAHFNSLFKKKEVHFDIYDSKKVIIKDSKKIKKITLLKKIPKNRSYFLYIDAGYSGGRFKIIKKVMRSNKVKNLIIEKYPFSKVEHYHSFSEKFHNILNKCYINTWAPKLAEKTKNIKNVQKIKVYIPENQFLTNIIHYLYFIQIKLGDKIAYKKGSIKKIFESKRLGFNEIAGTFMFKCKNIEINFYSSKSSNKILFYTKNYFLKIFFLKSNKIKISDNKKEHLINFPLTKITNKIFYNQTIKKINTRILPKYLEIEDLFIMIIKSIYKLNKKIKIT